MFFDKKNINFTNNSQKFKHYGLSLFLLMTVYFLRRTAQPLLGEDAALLPFLLAVIFSAWFGSISSGITTVFGGAIIGIYFFIAPINRFGIHDVPDIIRLLIYLIEGILISIIIGSLKEAKKQLQINSIELAQSKQMADSANQTKSLFLANMSHEIRTPMNAILGFAEIMKHDNLTNTQRKEFINIIQRNTQSLCTLIDSILDLSKIEAGKFQIETLIFSPTSLINEVITLLQVKAHEKNIRLLHSEVNLPEFISSDSNKIRQILINIIGNAIKFTAQGSVVVSTCYKPQGKQMGLVEIEVQDTGIGINTDQQNKLFHDFTQANVSTTRKFGGTGLGLSLSRRIAQKLGGDIKLLESKDGSGSKFLITITVETADKTHLDKKNKENLNCEILNGQRILLVEDSPDNQALISHFLKPYKIELAIESDGLSGANHALFSPFDIILMDIQMPGMDGYEALRVLRKKSYRGKIFALTAHAMVEERQKCLDAGFDGFLSKPISRDTLVKTLIEALKEKDTGPNNAQ